jgi:hypothetical protein
MMRKPFDKGRDFLPAANGPRVHSSFRRHELRPGLLFMSPSPPLPTLDATESLFPAAAANPLRLTKALLNSPFESFNLQLNPGFLSSWSRRFAHWNERGLTDC